MTSLQSLLSLSGIFLLACCSPGPVFLLIATVSAKQGRADGICVGFGVAIATLCWSLLTVLGLGVVLASVVWAQSAIRLVAGLYLLWLGISMIFGSLGGKSSLNGATALRRTPFMSGFAASITNPKALAFFSSAFAITAPEQPSIQYYAAAVCVLTILSVLWHSLLAIAFASGSMQRAYGALKTQIDLFVGVFLACFGGTLVFEGLRRRG